MKRQLDACSHPDFGCGSVAISRPSPSEPCALGKGSYYSALRSTSSNSSGPQILGGAEDRNAAGAPADEREGRRNVVMLAGGHSAGLWRPPTSTKDGPGESSRLSPVKMSPMAVLVRSVGSDRVLPLEGEEPSEPYDSDSALEKEQGPSPPQGMSSSREEAAVCRSRLIEASSTREWSSAGSGC